MSKVFSTFGLAIGIAAAAAVVYAQKRAAETGKDTMSVLSNLPAELKESQAVWQKKLEEAVVVGKKAAAQKEAEIEQELEKEPPAAPNVDYVV